jgi:SAM-dependent methyltransferase
MSAQPPSEPVSSASEGEVYIHGYSAEHRQFLAVRTAASEASFLLPHLRPGMSLVDCGCGQGSITVGLAETVAPGQVVGIDREPSQIEAARALAAERGIANVRFEVGSIYELPFADATLDAAFAHTVLEHLSDPPRALRELRRVLKPGGVVGIKDPDYATLLHEPATPLLTEAMMLIRRVQERNGGSPYYARHQRRLLLEAGFARSEGFASVACLGDALATRNAFELIMRPQLQERSFVETAIIQGWADQARLDAMLAAMEAWAARPDAFFALTLCAAIGWVDNAAST